MTTPLERIVESKQDIAACLRESAANLSGFGGRCLGNKEKIKWLDGRVEYLRWLADDVEALDAQPDFRLNQRRIWVQTDKGQVPVESFAETENGAIYFGPYGLILEYKDLDDLHIPVDGLGEHIVLLEAAKSAFSDKMEGKQ